MFLEGRDWVYLLRQQPQFADKCDWPKLDAFDWRKLIELRPEFVEKCDMGKFTGRHLAKLLTERGRTSPAGLLRRAEECDFSTLTVRDWCNVLAVRPDLADKFETSSHDWAADNVPVPEDVEAALS